MAHNFSLRARKLAWSFHDDKSTLGITSIRRVGTDSTLNDSDDGLSVTSCVRRLDISDDVSKLASALKQDGCVIVEGFTDLESLKSAMNEMKPAMKRHHSQIGECGTPLIKQSPTVRNNFYANTAYQELCDQLLTVETMKRKGNAHSSELCKPILSSAEFTLLNKSQSDASLARHDVALGIKRQPVEKYQQGHDKMIGLVVPGSKSTRVHVALGSHLSGNEQPNVVHEEELEIGEALIVLGSVLYSITPETEHQENEEPTIVYSMWSCAGIYRPEEPSASMISVAEVRTYPAVVRERLR